MTSRHIRIGAEQWDGYWRPLPRPWGVWVDPDRRRITFDDAVVPDPPPASIVDEIEAKIAGRDDDAPRCRPRLTVVGDDPGDDAEPDPMPDTG